MKPITPTVKYTTVGDILQDGDRGCAFGDNWRWERDQRVVEVAENERASDSVRELGHCCAKRR